jgi:heme/copper-type cytochrome/quinol oxidase subunit 2
MVSVLKAWLVTLFTWVITGMLWVVAAPVVSALYTATSDMLPEEATSASMMLRLEFILFPIAISIGFTVWAFLVTTRRQVVTTRGEYY